MEDQKSKSNSDRSRFIVLREGANHGHIIEAENAQAAAVEGARRCSVAGLRKGERLTVAPVPDAAVFIAQYDPPDWKWNGDAREVKVVVSRAA